MVTQKHEAGGNIPIPDPSVLTTEALRREIDGLRELIEEKLASATADRQGVRSIIETRLAGMDEAILLLQNTADKFPARIDEKIGALKEVHDGRFDSIAGVNLEKFSSIQTQFRERDSRTEQSSKDSKVAVDAALQAAKEAVGEQNKSSALAIAKSEAATTKQIDGLGVQLGNYNKASDDKITDLKERLTRLEGTGAGKAQVWAAVAIIVGIVVSLNVFFGLKASDRTAPQPQLFVQPPTQYVPAAPAPERAK